MKKIKVGDKIEFLGVTDQDCKDFNLDKHCLDFAVGDISKIADIEFYAGRLGYHCSKNVCHHLYPASAFRPAVSKKTKVKITSEQAKSLYETSTDTDFKDQLEAKFTKEDLGLSTPIEKKSPIKFEDLESVEGYYMNAAAKIYIYEGENYGNMTNRNTFPKEEQAEAVLALSEILQLMRHESYNGDWDGESDEFVSLSFKPDEKNVVYATKKEKGLLLFKNKEVTERFIKDQEELLKKVSILQFL